MIFIPQLSKIFANQSAGLADKKPFSFIAVKKNGDILRADNAILTSSNYHRRTVNVKFIESQEIRKLRLLSFVQFNGESVCP